MSPRRIVWVLVLAFVARPPIAAADETPQFGHWTDVAEVIYSQGPAVVRVPTAALILSGQSGGAIPIAVLATPLSERTVSVLIEIEAPAFASEFPEVGLEVFVYALDAIGQVAASATQRFEIDGARHHSRLGQGLAVLTPLEVPPGSYDLRVLVRHLQSDELGIGTWPLTVPRWDAETIVGPPWWLAPATGRLVALPPVRDSDGPPVAPLVLLAGEEDGRNSAIPNLPSAVPRFETSTAAVGCVLARLPQVAGALMMARFELADGAPVAELPLTIRARGPSPWLGLDALWLSMRIPHIEPGRYELRLSFVAPGQDPIELPTSSLQVFARHGPQLAAISRGDGAEPEIDSEPSMRRRRLLIPAREVAAGYRQALRRLAFGEADAARTDVADLEKRSAGAAPLALDDLSDLQWRTLAKLADERWHALLPVVLLHDRLIDDYRQRQEVHLTEHALRLTVRLAEELATRASTAEARAEAFRAVANLAGRLQALQRLGQSDALLERALTLERSSAGDAAARLALAANDERRGFWENAVEDLEALVRHHPEHPEGRLRLAVNLARMGRLQESAALLDGLRTGTTPSWIRELAHQEAAKLALLDGRSDLARQVLRDALRLWPDHLTFRIQLASVLDQIGRPRAARETLRLLDRPKIDPRRDNPRVRYTEWPVAIRDLRPVLNESAETRLVDLAGLFDPAVKTP